VGGLSEAEDRLRFFCGIIAGDAARVFAQKAAHACVVPAVEIVLEAGDGVELLAGIAKQFVDRRAVAREADYIAVGVHDFRLCASGLRLDCTNDSASQPK
jgi:hypothetical protein